MSPARAFLVVCAILGGGLGLGIALADEVKAGVTAPYAGLDTFARGLHTIEQRHVVAVPRSTLLYGAMRGMVGVLDEHSAFLDPEAYGALVDRTERAAEAIGVEVAMSPQGAVIQRIMPRGPGELAGLRVGDLVLEIDGASVVGLLTDEVMTLLQGERGTPVRLKLRRDGAEQTVDVVRDEVIEVAVEGELLAPGFGLVTLHNFRRRVGADTGRLLQELGAQTPLQGIILDLRGNPGGLMDEAEAVLDLFLPAGPLIETRGRDGAVLTASRSTDSAADLKGRVVVLIDGGSASASEVVAGSLQELHRAVLVGVRSYGKGSVQETRVFEDGSALKLTVARYHLPGGKAIADHEGLVPDLVVERPKEEPAAVVALRQTLAGAALTPAERGAVEAQLAALAAKGAPVEVPRTGDLAARLAADAQLAAAWERLRAGP